MTDRSVKKVTSQYSPRGEMGQKYLASGIHASMRLWDKLPVARPKPPTQRDYEVAGYVIEGRAELQLEGQMVLLEPGDSWDRTERIEPQLYDSGAVHRCGSDESASAGPWTR